MKIKYFGLKAILLFIIAAIPVSASSDPFMGEGKQGS